MGRYPGHVGYLFKCQDSEFFLPRLVLEDVRTGWKFECDTFGLKGRSSGSIFGQVNALHRNWPMADSYL